MIIDFSELSASQRYFAMVQSIIPRPIAWVLSDNGQGTGNDRYNLAPYSFFTGICSDPPLLMLSAGKKVAGDEVGAIKDTASNIIERKNFVVHIASTSNLNELNASAATLNHGESELALLGLATSAFAGSPLPRLSACDLAMYCTLYRHDIIGHTPQQIIYGQIHLIFANDSICQYDEHQRLRIAADTLQPLARLGAADYASIGQKMKANRPK